jgi:hypothetical protein
MEIRQARAARSCGSSVTVIALFAATFAGFLLLCIGQGRAWGAPSQPRRISATGWVILIASALISIEELGFGYGLVVWLGVATITANSVVLLLSWRRGRANA